mmetsp:Transcript_23273/g.51083  ORF Transcript_23273/g.51083 Transcript_23273/m.51083 type:complete len:441 (-) Transcript_23273:248-1570(-)
MVFQLPDPTQHLEAAKASHARTAGSAADAAAAAASAASEMPLAVQIEHLALRANACEARFGMDAERAADVLSNLKLGKFGTGKAKSLDQLSAEVQKGSAQLMLKEDAHGACQPVRVVDAILLRLRSEKVGGKLLVELDEQYAPPDNRKFDTNRLPGLKRERNETPKESIQRLMADKLKMANLTMSLNYDKTDVYTEEKESESFPGINTLYRMEIIEGYITSTDIGIRAEFELDEEAGTFKVTDNKHNSRTYGWLTEDQALERQVKLHGGVLGMLTMPVLTPVGAVMSQTSGTMQQRIAEVSKKVDSFFAKDKKLLELEKHVANVEAWSHTEPSQTISLLRQDWAKRRYVANHEQHLREFTKVLADVSRMQSCINPPGLQEIPSCNERLRRLEARSAVAVGTACKLHESVAKVAEDYHKAMIGLNEQLLKWDTLLESKGKK